MPLLLLLRLPWQVWGAEAFLGEWERAPRGRGGHCQVMEGLKPRECAAGKVQGGFGRVSWDLSRNCHLYLGWGSRLVYST